MKYLEGNNKRKFYLVLAGLPIMLIISWQLAFSQTYKSVKSLSNLKQNALKYENAEQMLHDLRSEVAKLKEIEKISPEDVDEVLLEIVSKNIGKYGITLEEFPEIHEDISSNYSTHTYNLTFSGRFISLLKFTNFLESEFSSGKIISVGYERTEERKSGEKLYMEIYYQLIFKNQ